MRDGLPAGVSEDEAALLGARLAEPQAYWRAMLASQWRVEVLVERAVTALERMAGAEPPAPSRRRKGL